MEPLDRCCADCDRIAHAVDIKIPDESCIDHIALDAVRPLIMDALVIPRVSVREHSDRGSVGFYDWPSDQLDGFEMHVGCLAERKVRAFLA